MSDCLLRIKEVMKRTGLPRSSLYRYIKTGIFPAPIQIGPKAVAWPESKIDSWVEDRKEGRPLAAEAQ